MNPFRVTVLSWSRRGFLSRAKMSVLDGFWLKGFNVKSFTVRCLEAELQVCWPEQEGQHVMQPINAETFVVGCLSCCRYAETLSFSRFMFLSGGSWINEVWDFKVLSWLFELFHDGAVLHFHSPIFSSKQEVLTLQGDGFICCFWEDVGTLR